MPRALDSMPRMALPPRSLGLPLFLWVRGRMLATAWRGLIHAPLKCVVMVLTWGTLLLGAYLLTYRGLQFLYEEAGLGPFLLDRLWYLFLFVISVMLFFSHLATTYSTMIRSEETAWWMGMPLTARWIVRAKWLEASCYSAWAVVLLVLPMGVAYVRILERPLWGVAWLIVLLLGLVAMMTALSTGALLVWLRWIGPRVRIPRELFPVGLVAVALILFWLLADRQPTSPTQNGWFVAVQELLPRMQIATAMWLPSSWMARALSAGVHAHWMEASLYAGLLWSTAVVSLRALDHLAARLLLPVLRGHGALPRPGPSVEGPGAPHLAIRWWMSRPFTACVAKDVLMLVRDPAQWTQGLVFFGLLGAYFANIHQIAKMSVDPSWRIGVASLNLACTLLVFGSLAVRFLFPQMSLEGRRLWLLHIVPGGLRQLLFAKFVCYGLIALVVIEGLMVLSAHRLEIPGTIVWWLAGVGVFASLSLVGLTLGLGAWFIDLNAKDPAKIVSSSNGALALVLMLVYVGVVVWCLVMAWTAWVGAYPLGLVAATLGLVSASVLWGLVPLVRGIRTLERLEY